MVADFLNFAESFINHGLDLPYDEKQTLGAMRKLIWKITLGITRY